MLEEAQKRGATLIRGTARKKRYGTDDCGRSRSDNGATRWDNRGHRSQGGSGIVPEWRPFLANQKVTGPKYVGSYDKQIAFFSHVKGALRDSGTAGETAKDNTLIFYKKKFHWAWFIPVDDEVVSLGLVVPTRNSKRIRKPRKTSFAAILPEINPN
jgi:hypothetical protein